MFKFAAFLAFVLQIVVCTNASADSTPAPEQKNVFVGKLVLEDLVPPDDRKFKLKEDLEYVDPSGIHWYARSGLVFDGASIPRSLWTIIGSPYTGTYRRAAVLHDYYCDNHYRIWQDVHRMFYDAMLTDGTGSFKAKVMYYAVYRFGPRWSIDEIVTCPKGMACAKPGDLKVSVAHPIVDDAAAVAEMQGVEETLKQKDLTLNEIEALAASKPNLTFSHSVENLSDNWVEYNNRSKSPNYVPPEKMKTDLDKLP